MFDLSIGFEYFCEYPKRLDALACIAYAMKSFSRYPAPEPHKRCRRGAHRRNYLRHAACSQIHTP